MRKLSSLSCAKIRYMIIIISLFIIFSKQLIFLNNKKFIQKDKNENVTFIFYNF